MVDWLKMLIEFVGALYLGATGHIIRVYIVFEQGIAIETLTDHSIYCQPRCIDVADFYDEAEFAS